MSTLKLANGDDHPDAAGKHINDALVLEERQRSDGAAYLAGYVIECCLKSLILLERGIPLPNAPHWRTNHGHNINWLAGEAATVSALAGAKTARYVGIATRSIGRAAVASWRPEMRYRSPSITPSAAQTWVLEALFVYEESVAQMLLDGVI